MKETLRDKMIDTCWKHFTELAREITVAADAATIAKINDEIDKALLVVSKIKEVFAK